LLSSLGFYVSLRTERSLDISAPIFTQGRRINAREASRASEGYVLRSCTRSQRYFVSGAELYLSMDVSRACLPISRHDGVMTYSFRNGTTDGPKQIMPRLFCRFSAFKLHSSTTVFLSIY
jgi:hypothetical protein